MGYVLDEGVWVKKASYKPKIKNASPEGPSCVKIDGSQDSILNSLLFEAQDIKQSLGAVVGDLHKCTELLGKLSADVSSLQAQISIIQKEGEKRKELKSISCNNQEDMRKSNQQKTKHPFQIWIHHSQGNQIIKEGKKGETPINYELPKEQADYQNQSATNQPRGISIINETEELASCGGLVALEWILPGTGGGFGILGGRLQTGEVGSSRNSTLSTVPPSSSSMRMLKDPPKDSTADDSQGVCKSSDAINY
ncbi:hypothetical protein HAX54_034216 [Datura stramonium]|uniref:Uncharacterized protein n=1 Tax=Datura stramonium TaxID=4076 RepID=A0ABS8VHD2_DATST|nr:hypothetical protein [Datura stramonium]